MSVPQAEMSTAGVIIAERRLRPSCPAGMRGPAAVLLERLQRGRAGAAHRLDVAPGRVDVNPAAAPAAEGARARLARLHRHRGVGVALPGVQALALLARVEAAA